MSISLAIDTSTSRTSVAILDDAKVIWSAHHDGALDHGKALSELIAKALSQSFEFEKVYVGMGPGPFTGLRVGIAFAWSFALARKIEVIGVCSLDAITSGASEYVAATDARRKEIYWARYIDGKRVEGPAVSAPSEVNSPEFIGEGAHKYGLANQTQFPDLALFPSLSQVSEPMYLRRPDAVPTSERAQ
jgi:tRNA threonylcarbamoyl adenosine modification protein YeaZ